MYLITGIYVPCYSHITQTRFNVKLGSVKPGNKAYSAKQYWFHSLTTRERLSIRQKNYLLLYGYEKSNKQVCVVDAKPERKLRKELCQWAGVPTTIPTPVREAAIAPEDRAAAMVPRPTAE